jgi:hypothetical protein
VKINLVKQFTHNLIVSTVVKVDQHGRCFNCGQIHTFKVKQKPFIRLHTLATLDIAPKSKPKNKNWP